jgi:hypothetical protein
MQSELAPARDLQVLIGVAAIVLGILSFVAAAAATLLLVGLLVVGAGLLATSANCLSSICCRAERQKRVPGDRRAPVRPRDQYGRQVARVARSFRGRSGMLASGWQRPARSVMPCAGVSCPRVARPPDADGPVRPVPSARRRR